MKVVICFLLVFILLGLSACSGKGADAGIISPPVDSPDTALPETNIDETNMPDPSGTDLSAKSKPANQPATTSQERYYI